MNTFSEYRSTKIGKKLRNSTLKLIIATVFVTALPLIVLFSASYLKSNLSQMNTIVKQIIQQLDLNTSNIIACSRQFPEDPKLLSLLSQEKSSQNTAQIENRLMELCGSGSGIKNILFLCDKGKFHSAMLSDSQMNNLLESPYFLSLKEREYTRYFSLPNEESDTLYLSMPLNDISSLSGEMIVLLRSEDLLSILTSAEKTFRHYIWIDNQNQPILNCSFSQEDYLFHLLSENGNSSFWNEYIFYNKSGIFISHYSSITRWKLIAFVPYSELFLPFLPIFFILIASIAFIVLLSGTVLKPLIYNIIFPLELLSDHIRKFSYGKDCPVDIHTGDEIEELSHAFNDMSSELKKHVEMLLNEQKKEQVLQYGLRVYQINPHFIYNTMNIINYLARKKRTNDIVVVNNALIHIMKNTLRINETSVFDTVDTECSVAQQYLKIQEYRYEEKIKIIWDVDPATRNLFIPKQILQPLIENSIIHGFLDNELESCIESTPYIKISIQLFPELKQISLKVEDNGAGIDMEKYHKICEESEHFDASNELTRGKHIGLANIRWRLSYLFREEDTLTVSLLSPHGTAVSLKLPVKKDASFASCQSSKE